MIVEGIYILEYVMSPDETFVSHNQDYLKEPFLSLYSRITQK